MEHCLCCTFVHSSCTFFLIFSPGVFHIYAYVQIPLLLMNNFIPVGSSLISDSAKRKGDSATAPPPEIAAQNTKRRRQEQQNLNAQLLPSEGGVMKSLYSFSTEISGVGRSVSLGSLPSHRDIKKQTPNVLLFMFGAALLQSLFCFSNKDGFQTKKCQSKRFIK